MYFLNLLRTAPFNQKNSSTLASG